MSEGLSNDAEVPVGGQLELLAPEVADQLLVQVAESRPDRRRFTGRLIEREEARLELILERLALGCSQREVARLFGVSRNTLSALMERCEKSGRLEPYKERLAGKMARVIEAGVESLGEAIVEGKLPVAQIPLAVGILSDKRAALVGEAGLRVDVVVRRELRPEQVAESAKRLVERLRAGKVIDVDTGDNYTKDAANTGN